MNLLNLNTVLANTSSFADLDSLVKDANEDISFWGFRYVYVPGYKGKVHIDALAKKVNTLVRASFDFSEEERELGKQIVSKINQLYTANDNRKKTNLITRIFLAIRDYWNANIADGWGYNTRFYWERNEYFELYTQSQYEQVFGKSPDPEPDDVERGCPNRWYGLGQEESDI